MRDTDTECSTTWKTWECQGILMQVREFLKNKKSQGKVMKFCYVKLIFSQSEHPNFKTFLGEHAPRPP